MKTFLSLVIFLSAFFHASAQTWIENNAVWHYDFSNIASGGYYKVEHIGDTLLGGEQAKILEGTRYWFGYDGPTGPLVLLGVGSLGQEYVRADGDTVFRWNEGEYRKLLDFSAQVNDTWVIDVDTQASAWMCNDTSRVRVFGTGTENIQGTNYDYIDLEQVSGSFKRLEGRFYKRFAGNYFSPRFSICDPSIILDDDFGINLRCFSDDGLSLSFVAQDCDYLITHVGLAESAENAFQLAPNPAGNSLQILGSPREIIVYNVEGKELIKSSDPNGILQLDISKLPQGLYVVEMSSGSHISRQRLIKE